MKENFPICFFFARCFADWGGFGGDKGEAVNVPFIIYQKGSGLASKYITPVSCNKKKLFLL
jgi:hypothetical protein